LWSPQDVTNATLRNENSVSYFEIEKIVRQFEKTGKR